MTTQEILNKISTEHQSAYEQLKNEMKVDLSWDNYIEEIARITSVSGGNEHDANYTIKDFVNQF